MNINRNSISGINVIQKPWFTRGPGKRVDMHIRKSPHESELVVGRHVVDSTTHKAFVKAIGYTLDRSTTAKSPKVG